MKQIESIKVGTFFVLGMVLLAAIFELVAGRTTLLRGYTLHTWFDSTLELKTGDPVRLAGVIVGDVESIELEPESVHVVLKIQPEVRIRADAVASIRMTGLLGQNYIYISLGSPEAPVLADGDRLASMPAMDLVQTIQRLGEISGLVGDLRSTLTGPTGLLGRASALLAPDGNLALTLANAEAVTAALRDGRGTAGRLIQDDALYSAAESTLAQSSRLLAGIREGRGTLGRLVTDETLYEDTDSTVRKVGDVADAVASSRGTLGLLLHDDRLYVNAADAAGNLNAILAKIVRGEGVLGKAMQDEDFAREVRTALQSITQASEEVETQGPLAVLGLLMGTAF